MKLYYFDVPGRAESIRLLLHHAKIPFGDIRVQLSDWPKLKDTFEGKQLPVLEFEGTQYAQSLAILYFLGIKYGYLPTSPQELNECTYVINICEDINAKLFAAYAPYSPYDEETKKKLQSDIPKDVFSIYLNALEEKLQYKSCKEFLVGEQYTIADFYFLSMILMMKFGKTEFKQLSEFTGIPLLMEYFETRCKDFEFYLIPKYIEKPKLYYFDGPWRGEMIRLLLKHAKVDFDDIRIKFQDWPAMKDKFALKQLPVYECEGKQLPETDAIMHMLSVKYGYLPLDSEKLYKVLFIINTFKDLFDAYYRFTYGTMSEEKKKMLHGQYFCNTVPLIFGILEKRLKENECQDYFVGDQYTMADFYALGTAKWLIFNPQTEANYSKFLEACPIFKAYLTKRLADFDK